MTNEVKHTKLPWTLKLKENPDEYSGYYTVEGGDKFCTKIIDDFFYYNIAPDKIEDATFIVLACNEHYQLVEDRKRLLAMVKEINTYTTKGQFSELCEKAAALIEQIEG